jgi:transposase InsO family protein
LVLVVTDIATGQNGVRERAFGTLKYEHLYHHEINTLDDLVREANAYRHVFNQIRPYEALGFHRPIEAHHNPALNPPPRSRTPNFQVRISEPRS